MSDEENVKGEKWFSTGYAVAIKLKTSHPLTLEQRYEILRIDNLLKESVIADLISNQQEYGRVERMILLDKLNAQINALTNRDWVKENVKLDAERSELRSKTYSLTFELNELRNHWAVKLLKKLGVMK